MTSNAEASRARKSAPYPLFTWVITADRPIQRSKTTADTEYMARRFIALFALLALLASACSSGSTTAAPPDSLPLSDVATTTTAPVETTTITAAPTTTSTAAPTTTTTTTSTVAPHPERTWVATAKDHVEWLQPHVEPGGEFFEMPWGQPNPHQFGTTLTLMVTEGQIGDEWVKVQLPIRPNGQEAWVSTADYDISEIFTRAEVNLSTRRVTVWENGEVIAETDAVVGGSSSRTPIGSYFVVASAADYFGEPALVLSSFSEDLDTFSGGLPVIAIHRTFAEGQESDAHAASNGCIRIPPEAIRFLSQNVPLGTPVDFVS